MKLRNKKTGEIIEFDAILPVKDVSGDSVAHLEYDSLTELNEEWEDYEESKEWYWFIEDNGVIQRSCHYEDLHPTLDKARKEIGNYFDTKEEAEQAVKKLEAWKRVKDVGFRFDGWTIDDGLRISICTNIDSEGIYDDDKKEMKKELDLLFGGEE